MGNREVLAHRIADNMSIYQGGGNIQNGQRALALFKGQDKGARSQAL